MTTHADGAGATVTSGRVTYTRTTMVDGHTVFYREAGDPANPTILLLHGFPTSSHMFRRLITDLADDFHLVAPDMIGFGFSDAPQVDGFEYSFRHLTEITVKFVDQLKLDKFAVYIMDYGAPIGLTIASTQPERVSALLVQSGNAYLEGFTPFWDILFAHAKDRPSNEAGVRKYFLPERTKWQYTFGVPEDRLNRLSPETWTLDQTLMERPGNTEIQLQLFWDYQFNLDLYPGFQEYFRTHRPPTLITWGKNDPIFGAEGAKAYLRDLPDAELHLLDGGHFALETHGDEIADLIRDFLKRTAS
jgi:pimeloyl-ACP methyl ester carboxylesterase